MSWWTAGGCSTSRLLWACCSTHGGAGDWCVDFLGLYTRCRIAGSRGVLLLTLRVTCCFYSDCANSHSHPACASSPSPHLCCHLPFCVFPMTMTDILTCVRGWLIVVLICFTNNKGVTKGVFFFLIEVPVGHSLGNIARFQIGFLLLLSYLIPCTFWALTPIGCIIGWCFLSICRMILSCRRLLPLWPRSFLVQHNPICLFSILFSVLLGSSAKRLCLN